MDLGNFLKQRDIIYTLCAASISTQIVLIADLITTSCVMPFIDKNKIGNEHTIEQFTVKFGEAHIGLGKIFVAIIRLIIVIIILYLVYSLTY